MLHRVQEQLEKDMLAALSKEFSDWELRVDTDDSCRVSVGFRKPGEWWKTFIVPYERLNSDSLDPAIKMWVFMKIIPEKWEHLTSKQRIDLAIQMLKDRLDEPERYSLPRARRSSRYAV